MSNQIYKLLKRSTDILIAYFLLMLCYIPICIIAISIKLYDNGPAIFKQVRIGLKGKKFICYKFRTMNIDAPNDLATKDFHNSNEYITPIGAFLRRTSLDELPQLFNVLAGDMSIIGPRPLIENETDIHKMRKSLGVYEARPGITGLSQVCGRDKLSDVRKAQCDAVYVKNISFAVDVKILFATVSKVVKREDICDTTTKLLDNTPLR